MTIRWVEWKEKFVEKIADKHQVDPNEVEEVFGGRPWFRKAAKGRTKGEDLYAAYGRTAVGRYLFVVFILKKPDRALPITARDMTQSEKRRYGQQKRL